MKEETHVADYVFDESKDPSEMLCAYGGYGVTRGTTSMLSRDNFIDFLEDIVGDPKLCHTWMYAILYMQYWDGSGLNRTINFEFTDKLIEENEFDADQKDAFKNFVKDNVREAKKANRQAREARKRPCRNELVD
ncbi:hypothetical protein CK203_117443 [Vitis vinifera]|uniref:Uncharacterized protein n=1 Tax=Vitis vinifera TaxID=29760 RepID=A0A438CQT0_VITVI|nr:hypothetical protein CK203_117443 [Vitis vinifera]